MALNARQELFALEYLKDLNATQAAIRAGYSVASATQEGARQLANVNVQKFTAEHIHNRRKRVVVEADFVLRELMALASVDLAAAYDESGALKPIHDIPANVRKAIAAVQTHEEFETINGVRTSVGWTTKLKLWDRTRALEMLGRHLALFNDKLDVNVTLNLVPRITQARDRLSMGSTIESTAVRVLDDNEGDDLV